MKKLILLFCCCFLAGNLVAQSTLIKNMDDPMGSNHTQHNMIEYESGVIIAGTASPGPISGTASDIYVQRLDLDGNIIWGKYFYYNNSSFVGGLTHNEESGNIVLTGYTGTLNGMKDVEIWLNF